MKIYLAGLETGLRLGMGKLFKRGLVSFCSFKEKDIPMLGGIEVFLDSGAYSAFTQGSSIDIDKYADFCKQYQDKFKVYATLDVIGDWEATKKNTEYLESKGLSPLPVFQYQSPKEELKRLVDKYDYIALGGLVPFARRKKTLRNWLDFCFSIIKDKAKVHGFGITGLSALKRYPFYSVDSTGWLVGSKYGRGLEFKKLRQVSIKQSHLHYKIRNLKAIKQYQELEKQITDLWKAKGVIWE